MGYPTKKLGEICDLYQPKTISTKEMIDDGNYPVFGANGIIGKYNKYNHEEKELLITCRGATCGSINISEKFSWINGNAMISHIKDNNIVYFNFLYYVFKNLDFSKVISGSAQPQITRGGLVDLPIPIPPLPTQKLIVQKLDSSFEKIDKSIKLTKKNLKNIEELNKSVLEEVFSEGEYEMKKIGEICDFIGSGFACNKSNEVIGGYTHLRTHNIGTDGKLNFDLFVDINPDKVDLNKSKIYKGDVLFNNTNSKELVGKTAYVDDNYNYGYSNHITRLVVNKNYNSNYVSLYLNLLFKKGFFANICNKWIGQAGINNGMLKEIQIPLPPLQKQKEIVAQLDKVFEKNKALKENYEKKLKDLEEMKQSLLKEAFEGRLVKE